MIELLSGVFAHKLAPQLLQKHLKRGLPESVSILSNDLTSSSPFVTLKPCHAKISISDYSVYNNAGYYETSHKPQPRMERRS